MLRFVILAIAVALPSPAPAQEAKPDLVVKEVVAGMPKGDKQEFTILTATFQPGRKTPFHTHRFPVGVYVLEGAFTLEMEGPEPVVLTVGQDLVEPPNVKMTGYNKATEQLKAVIVYVADPGPRFWTWLIIRAETFRPSRAKSSTMLRRHP